MECLHKYRPQLHVHTKVCHLFSLVHITQIWTLKQNLFTYICSVKAAVYFCNEMCTYIKEEIDVLQHLRQPIKTTELVCLTISAFRPLHLNKQANCIATFFLAAFNCLPRVIDSDPEIAQVPPFEEYQAASHCQRKINGNRVVACWEHYQTTVWSTY